MHSFECVEEKCRMPAAFSLCLSNAFKIRHTFNLFGCQMLPDSLNSDLNLSSEEFMIGDLRMKASSIPGCSRQVSYLVLMKSKVQSCSSESLSLTQLKKTVGFSSVRHQSLNFKPATKQKCSSICPGWDIFRTEIEKSIRVDLQRRHLSRLHS